MSRQVTEVIVYDLHGNTALREAFPARALSLAPLGGGTYLVQLRFADGHAVSKRMVVL